MKTWTGKLIEHDVLGEVAASADRERYGVSERADFYVNHRIGSRPRQELPTAARGIGNNYRTANRMRSRQKLRIRIEVATFFEKISDIPAGIELGLRGRRCSKRMLLLGARELVPPLGSRTMSTHFILHGPHALGDLVARRLNESRHWWSRDVEARIDDAGEVWLTGRVSSWYQKQVAQESLRDLQGLRRIRNELCVVR